MLKKPVDYLRSDKGREEPAERFNRVTIWILRILVFVFPFFVLPWSSLPLESMKAYLVTAGAFAVLILFALSSLFSSKIVIRFHPILLGSLAFLITATISALFSGSGRTAFLGIGGREMFSVLSILALTLVTVLVTAATRKKSDWSALILAGSAGIAVAGALELLQLSGRFPYMFAFTHQRIWSSLGTPKIFVFISAMGVLISLLCLRLEVRKKITLPFVSCLLFLLIDLFVLLRIDFYGAWLMLALGLLIFSILSFFGEAKNLLWQRYLPMALFIFSMVFTMAGSPIRQNLIPEFQLDPDTSWDVTFKSLKGHFLFGTGPGTFEFSYSRFRPVEFNSSERWNTRFDRPGTNLLTLLATTGIIGFLSWAAPFLILLWALFQRVIKKGWKDNLPFVCSVVVFIIFISSFFFASNFVLSFYLALSLGLSAAVLGKDFEFYDQSSTRARLIKKMIFILILIFAVRGIAYEVKAMAGEHKLGKGLNPAYSLSQRYAYLKASQKLAGGEPRVLRAYARAALQSANEEAKNQNVDTKKVQELLGSATAAVKRATEIEPADVDNWMTLGAVYQNLLPFVEGSGEWVVRAYSEALDREPTNPLPHVEMGKSFITLGDRMRREGVEADLVQHIFRNAEEELIKAIQVKADYAPAHFYLGLVYDRQGRVEDAVLKLEAVERYNPSDVGVAYELGLLYLRRGNLEKARLEFSRAVANLPSYSDARWQLANTLLRQGKPNEAISELKKILEYSLENVNVIRAIEEIKQGRTRL